MSAHLERVDADGFAPLLSRAAQIYGEAMARRPEQVVQRREIMQSHLGRPSFQAVLAYPEDGGHEPLIGFGYGYRGAPGDWFHDVVARRLGAEPARAWLSDAFELAELHLMPAFHGQGIGRAMLQTLLDVAGTQTVVLSTHDQESPARALYRACGFVDLATEFRFPGSAEVYAIMGRRSGA